MHCRSLEKSAVNACGAVFSRCRLVFCNWSQTKGTSEEKWRAVPSPRPPVPQLSSGGPASPANKESRYETVAEAANAKHFSVCCQFWQRPVGHCGFMQHQTAELLTCSHICSKCRETVTATRLQNRKWLSFIFTYKSLQLEQSGSVRAALLVLLNRESSFIHRFIQTTVKQHNDCMDNQKTPKTVGTKLT